MASGAIDFVWGTFESMEGAISAITLATFLNQVPKLFSLIVTPAGNLCNVLTINVKASLSRGGGLVARELNSEPIDGENSTNILTSNLSVLFAAKAEKIQPPGVRPERL